MVAVPPTVTAAPPFTALITVRLAPSAVTPAL